MKKGQLLRLVRDDGINPRAEVLQATVVQIEESKGKGGSTPLTYLGIKFAGGK